MTNSETNEPIETVEGTESHSESLAGVEPGTDTYEGSETLTEAYSEDETVDSFPRSYVEKLRREAQSLRERAMSAEAAQESVKELQRQLVLERVKADGRLVEASELPFDETYATDPEALTAAVTELLERKPYLSSQRFSSTLHQGATATDAGFSFVDALRRNA